MLPLTKNIDTDGWAAKNFPNLKVCMLHSTQTTHILGLFWAMSYMIL